MQWGGGPGAGFTTGRPWLRLAPDAATRNVETQSTDPDSVLACYRRLLTFRRDAAALRRGSMERLDAGVPDVLAWTRDAAGRRLLVLVSFVGEPRTVDLGAVTGDRRWTARVGSHRVPAEPDGEGRLSLRPDEAVVLEAASD